LFCCSTPDLGWAFNITNEPAFADLPVANFHLQTNSPCINSGANLYAAPGPDLDGNPRVSGGKPDIGAFEVQNPRSIISYAWLAANGFSADGSADFADPDGDHMNNWQEWIAGTDPQDAASVLKMYAPAPGSDPNSVILSWSGISGRCYFLERATTLTPPDFTDLVFVSNLVVQSGTNYYQDVLPAGTNAAFYRVRTDSETIVFP
jgi:hypothetical protein